MKKLILALVALSALASVSALAADNCDPAKFTTATGCEGRQAVFSATFTNRLHNKYFNYCKQYGSKLAVLTAGAEGNVVVINKTNCTKETFVVDKSGIAELKVVGGFAYFRSNDGQLYIVEALGRIFEIQSRNGNSYSKSNGSGVTDIKGDAKDSKVLHITNQSGTFDLTAGAIQGNNNRYRLLQKSSIVW